VNAVLAIDQGTTGTTCLLIDQKGKVRGRAYSEFTQYFPKPGWVEHDASEIWDVTLKVAREATLPSRKTTRSRTPMRPLAIGITNQRETVVVWDRKSGRPVHPAIVWQDRRTAARCRELKDDGVEPQVREHTGLLLDPYFSATKLAWILDRIPDGRSRAAAGKLAAGTIDTWLIWKLTGGRVHATDPTNASRTLLYNLRTQEWDDDMLALFGVPRSVLPEVRFSSSDFGVTDRELFGAEIPITGVAGDQQAALFGQGCWTAGMAKNTYGTGAFLLLHTGNEPVMSSHGLLTTVACGANGDPAYALEGSVFIAGAAVQWLRDGLGVIRRADETAALAAELESNDGVYFVPAFVGLGAPHWDAEARGTIVGLTRGSGRAHFARAALEAMAYGTFDVLEAMIADSGVGLRELAVDGGASSNDWLMQFQADVLKVPVQRPQMIETTALGAAGLAGLGAGLWSDAYEFLEARAKPTRFKPKMRETRREECLKGWQRAIAAARAWSHDLPQ
jgi:glycerol kinase